MIRQIAAPAAALPVAALLALGLALPAMAEQKQVTKPLPAKAGQETQIGIFTRITPDCTVGEFKVKVASVAQNGTIARKEGKTKPGILEKCPTLIAPVVAFIYTPKDGFKGKDTLSIEFDGGPENQQLITYDVTVE